MRHEDHTTASAGPASTRSVPDASAAGLFLAVAYVGTVVTANWASMRWPAVVLGPLVVPAGTMWSGVTFTLRDLLHEALGAGGVIAGISVGAGLSWLLASPQIALASMLAFAVSETLDSAIYAVLRSRSRARAMVSSNVAGLMVDSLLFVPLAFGSLVAVPGQLVGKTVTTVLTLVMLRPRRPHRDRAMSR